MVESIEESKDAPLKEELVKMEGRLSKWLYNRKEWKEYSVKIEQRTLSWANSKGKLRGVLNFDIYCISVQKVNLIDFRLTELGSEYYFDFKAKDL